MEENGNTKHLIANTFRTYDDKSYAPERRNMGMRSRGLFKAVTAVFAVGEQSDLMFKQLAAWDSIFARNDFMKNSDLKIDENHKFHGGTGLLEIYSTEKEKLEIGKIKNSFFNFYAVKNYKPSYSSKFYSALRDYVESSSKKETEEFYIKYFPDNNEKYLLLEYFINDDKGKKLHESLEDAKKTDTNLSDDEYANYKFPSGVLNLELYSDKASNFTSTAIITPIGYTDNAYSHLSYEINDVRKRGLEKKDLLYNRVLLESESLSFETFLKSLKRENLFNNIKKFIENRPELSEKGKKTLKDFYAEKQRIKDEEAQKIQQKKEAQEKARQEKLNKYTEESKTVDNLLESFGINNPPQTKNDENPTPSQNAESTNNKAEPTDAKSQYELALKYEKGDGVEENPEKAFELYKKAAEQGNADAQNKLGRFYDEGIGCEQDSEKAFYWYEKAAEQNLAIAQYNVGACYEIGSGCEKNPEKSFYWYEKAADQGLAIAQYELGICYETGFGCEENKEQAFFWYKKAAEQGNADAQNELGQCYEFGTGCEENEEQAFFWYKKAAEQGDVVAQNKLGFYYNHGYGCEQNSEQAFYWYKKAAEQNLAVAQYNLGQCYEVGHVVEQNLEKAFELYKKSAEQWDDDAQNKLGEFYELGKGCEKNEEQAFFWYEKAAEQDNADAQYNLGDCYEYGTGCEENHEKAVSWYKKAAENGNEDAKKEIENI